LEIQQLAAKHIDMTTGIIFDIKRYAIHDGPGIRTTVFMKGCPLACPWCHNPEGIEPAPLLTYNQSRCIRCGACVENCPQKALCLTTEGVVFTGVPCMLCFTCTEVCPSGARQKIGRELTASQLFNEIRKDALFYDTSTGGVTFSGGEPLMQAEFLLEVLELCGHENLHRAVDTTGHASPKALMAVAAQTDLFLCDLKMMDPDRHKKYTGLSNHLILENLKRLAGNGADIIIRIPLIPGVNDDVKNLEQIGSFLNLLANVNKVHLLPYHDFQKSKYHRFGMPSGSGALKPPDRQQLARARKQLESFGLQVAIGG
jgi:pyruvate formate lyase activating enzyme